MSDQIIYSQICALKLPSPCTVLRNKQVQDMDHRMRNCVEVIWIDDLQLCRQAFFDAETGEYVGDEGR